MENDESQQSLPYDSDWIPTDIETWLPFAIIGNVLFPILKNGYIGVFYTLASSGKHGTFIGKTLGLCPAFILCLLFFLWFVFHFSVALDNKGQGLLRKFCYVWRKLFLLMASSLPMLPHIIMIFYAVLYW
jgi:hypothetical protein